MKFVIVSCFVILASATVYSAIIPTENEDLEKLIADLEHEFESEKNEKRATFVNTINDDSDGDSDELNENGKRSNPVAVDDDEDDSDELNANEKRSNPFSVDDDDDDSDELNANEKRSNPVAVDDDDDDSDELNANQKRSNPVAVDDDDDDDDDDDFAKMVLKNRRDDFE